MKKIIFTTLVSACFTFIGCQKTCVNNSDTELSLDGSNNVVYITDDLKSSINFSIEGEAVGLEPLIIKH